MKLPKFTPRQVSQAVHSKLGEHSRGSKEMQVYYWLDGKMLLRITLPKEHSRGTIPDGTLKSIMSQLSLSRDDFANLIRCPLSASGYEKIIRAKHEEGIL